MPNGEIAETFPFAAAFPSEEDVEMEIETAGAEAGVSPLDFDFLLFALPFAFAVDALDIVLEIAGAFVVIPKIIGIVIDIIVFLILMFPGWMYWRLKEIEKSKREHQESLQRAVQKSIQQLSKLQKTGKVSPQVFERYMRLYGKQMGTIGKAAARAARKPATRALIRGGLVFLGELAIIIGIIPFWTIGVILTLREK